MNKNDIRLLTCNNLYISAELKNTGPLISTSLIINSIYSRMLLLMLMVSHAHKEDDKLVADHMVEGNFVHSDHR